jgi:Lipase (class 3)
VCLSISGTRFGQSVGDLLDDAYILPTDLGGGVRVTSGAYSGMDALWAWAKSLVRTDSVWHVAGHSLGGQRALLTGLFVSVERIGSISAFEAPRTGNAALWSRLAPSLGNATHVRNGEDLWFGWPFISEWSHPPHPHPLAGKRVRDYRAG